MVGHLVQLLGIVVWVGQVVTRPQAKLVGQVVQGNSGQGLDVVELIQNVKAGSPKQVGKRFNPLVIAGQNEQQRAEIGLFRSQRVNDPGIGPGQEPEGQVTIVELVEMFDPNGLVIAVNQLRVEQVILVLLRQSLPKALDVLGIEYSQVGLIAGQVSIVGQMVKGRPPVGAG